ncbi:hypothetical protein Q1695_000785 [Nippostrongylus brasiliensis]|nr:hypothetical protein Q1695_000785 [Nippostrongylus brasiliensis]
MDHAFDVGDCQLSPIIFDDAEMCDPAVRAGNVVLGDEPSDELPDVNCQEVEASKVGTEGGESLSAAIVAAYKVDEVDDGTVVADLAVGLSNSESVGIPEMDLSLDVAETVIDGRSQPTEEENLDDTLPVESENVEKVILPPKVRVYMDDFVFTEYLQILVNLNTSYLRWDKAREEFLVYFYIFFKRCNIVYKTHSLVQPTMQERHEIDKLYEVIREKIMKSRDFPFTWKRQVWILFCEILLEPTRYYTKMIALMRGLARALNLDTSKPLFKTGPPSPAQVNRKCFPQMDTLVCETDECSDSETIKECELGEDTLTFEEAGDCYQESRPVSTGGVDEYLSGDGLNTSDYGSRSTFLKKTSGETGSIARRNLFGYMNPTSASDDVSFPPLEEDNTTDTPPSEGGLPPKRKVKRVTFADQLVTGYYVFEIDCEE